MSHHSRHYSKEHRSRDRSRERYRSRDRYDRSRDDRNKRNDTRKRRYSSDVDEELPSISRPIKQERFSEERWGKSGQNSQESKEKPIEKEKPNFETTGKLAEDTNKFRGVVIKYSEPPEARKPKRRWRLYPFKGEKELPVLYIHRQSGYLLGRDRKVADIPLDHPSCSKQHAALQYRLLPYTKEDGAKGQRIRLYLIDLESANGTFINNKKVEPRKYYELFERDVIKFGYSSREYVLLHEHSKDSDQDDDVLSE